MRIYDIDLFWHFVWNIDLITHNYFCTNGKIKYLSHSNTFFILFTVCFVSFKKYFTYSLYSFLCTFKKGVKYINRKCAINDTFYITSDYILIIFSIEWWTWCVKMNEHYTVTHLGCHQWHTNSINRAMVWYTHKSTRPFWKLNWSSWIQPIRK